jgi:O-antigen ligase
MAAANGTRSLLAGLFAHEILRQLGSLSMRSAVSLAVIAVGAYVGMDYLASIGSRVATLTDASAVGRWTLYEYGMQLARDNPFGYGWDFNPGDYAWLYWEQLSDMARAEAAFRLEIHNAFLNFVLLYGLYGVLIVGLAALFNPGLFIATIYFSIAYLVHSFFHNDGIFLGDDYFWFAFAILIFVRDTEKAKVGSRASAYAGRQYRQFHVPRPGLTRS